MCYASVIQVYAIQSGNTSVLNKDSTDQKIDVNTEVGGVEPAANVGTPVQPCFF